MRSISFFYSRALLFVSVATCALLPVAAAADIGTELTPADFDNPNDNWFVALLKVIFTPRYFEPHWEHFIFDPGLMWSLVIGNILIAVAYVLIPVGLLYFIKKRHELLYVKIFWWFVAFIFLCATHHVVHVVTFWYPIYHVQNIVDILTAIVSWGTFIVMLKTLPRAIKLRSAEELQKEIDERKKAEEQLRENDQILREQKLELQQTIKQMEENKRDLEKMNEVMVGRELKMIELKEKLNSITKEDTIS